MNDLVSVLALPAVWSGSDPHRILDTFLDALLVMLDLDFLYARVQLDSHQEPVDALRTARHYGTKQSLEEIGRALARWSSGDFPGRWSEPAAMRLGEQEVSVYLIREGLDGELGVILAGSQRAGFPEQTENLVLSVASNQLATALQHARRLYEQAGIASELDRRVAERTRELAEANKELQLQVGLLQHIPVAAWTLKPDGTPDFVNRVWLEYSGQTLDFVRSHPEAWMAAVHPDDREGAASCFWDGVRLGQSFAMETRVLSGDDGTYRWQLHRAVVLRDAEGKVLKFVGTSTDIDDQKRAEEIMLANERNLGLIINTMPVLAWSARADGNVDFFNQRWLDYTGLSTEQARGSGWGPAFHPDDLERLNDYWRSTIATGEPGEIEVRLRRFDGTYRWFLFRANPLRDESNAILQWYGTSTDIDGRKRAEEELRLRELNLRQITETIPEMLWSAGPDGMVDYCNGRLLSYAGLSSEAVMGNGWTKFLHPEDVESWTQSWKACVATGRPYRVEVRAFHALDRTYRWCVTSALPLRDRDGNIVKWHGTVVDMHDWKQAQEELRNTQAELSKITRITTMGELTASIAHEVSQPLSGIMTNANTCLRMLDASPPNIDGARETVRRTIRDGTRASDVIVRLRTLFSKKEVTIENVDLNEATREVIALIRSELQRNKVILTAEFADQLPILKSDRIQLQQVILNLVRNALDAMDAVEEGQRRLLIQTEQAGDYVRLAVQDSGVGLDPATADRMFESFFTTKPDGMGIGLSVSRSIIEAHHGRLWATANKGQGATFAFAVPWRYNDEH